MTRIQESLAAIKLCKPEENVYLCVIGEGVNQHLKAVKMNWWGRLLMLFGCSNASMTKVSKYISQNIDKICKVWFEGLEKNVNDPHALCKLVHRVNSYNRRYSHKIARSAAHIESVYNTQYSSFIHKLSSQNNATIIQQPSQSSAVNSSVAVPIIPPTSQTPPPPPFQSSRSLVPMYVLSPPLLPVLQPLPPALPPLPLRFPPLPSFPSFSRLPSTSTAVKEFSSMRGNIAVLVDVLHKQVKLGYDEEMDSIYKGASHEMKSVGELLKGKYNDVKAFQEIIQEMECYEVFYYFTFNLTNPAPHVFVQHEVFASECLEAAVEYMSKDQLNSAVLAYVTYCTLSHQKSFYDFANCINKFCGDNALKMEMLQKLVACPLYPQILSQTTSTKKIVRVLKDIYDESQKALLKP